MVTSERSVSEYVSVAATVAEIALRVGGKVVPLPYPTMSNGLANKSHGIETR